MYTRYKCPKCGYVFNGEVKYCPNCGQLFKYPNVVKQAPAPQSKQEEEAPRKRKRVEKRKERRVEAKKSIKSSGKNVTSLDRDEESHVTGGVVRKHVPVVKKHLVISLINALLLIAFCLFLSFIPFLANITSENGESSVTSHSAFSLLLALIKEIKSNPYVLSTIIFLAVYFLLIIIAIIAGIVVVCKNAKRLKDPYGYAYDYYCDILEKDSANHAWHFFRSVFFHRINTSIVGNAWSVFIWFLVLSLSSRIPYVSSIMAYNTFSILWLVVGCVFFVLIFVLDCVGKHKLSIYKTAILENKSKDMRKHFD